MTQVNSDSGKKLTQVKKLTQAKTDSGKKCPEEMPGGNARRKCLEELPFRKPPEIVGSIATPL